MPDDTPAQQTYRDLYARLSALLRRPEVEVEGEEAELRRRLWNAWRALTVEEREPFLAPACLDR